MAIFQANPQAVFPFKVERCDRFYTGAECTLRTGDPHLPGYQRVPYNSVGVVGVTTTPTSVKFTVLEHGYFDAPRSTIEFRTHVENGVVLLTQDGQAHGADWPMTIGVKIIGMSKPAWDAQQKALSDMVKEQHGR